MTIQDAFPGFGDLTLPSLSGIVATCPSSHHSLIVETVTAYEGRHWQSMKPCELISNWHTTWILDNGSSNSLQNVGYSHSLLTQLHSVMHQKGELPGCSPPQNKNWKQIL